MIQLRHATEQDWDGIAELIYLSTNFWYQANGKPPIFRGDPLSTRLFCEVYESIDPGRCLLAIDETTSGLVGSCFYHPRETHVSLGIMNAHPNHAGRGIARQLLGHILEFAQQQNKPLRLVSSAMNLDSYSLYNRAGLTPYAIYQDMILDVPKAGVADDIPDGKTIRDARQADVAAMVALEQQVLGIRRGSDFEYFIENANGNWHMSVIENRQGHIDGFLASIQHPASSMLGPGCMRDDRDSMALIRRELNHRSGHPMVWLVPADRPGLTTAMYELGARNCEIHFGQTTGDPPSIGGVVMPTFMPETA